MKLIVEREALLAAARTVASATARPTNVVKALHWCRFAAEDDGLTLTATDTDVWLSASVSVPDIESGGVEVINPTTIVQILREHNEREVLVKRNRDGQVVITVGGATYALDVQDAADFPDAPDVPSRSAFAETTAGALALGLRACISAAGEDTTQGGGHFATDTVQLALGPGGLAVVGTDGMCQHLCILGGEAKPEAAALLPRRATRTCSTALGTLDPATVTTVEFSRNTFRIAAGSLAASGALAFGRAAPWQGLTGWSCPVKCDRDALHRAIRGGLIAGPAQRALNVTFDPDGAESGKLTVRAQGKGGSAETTAVLAGTVPRERFRVDGLRLAAFLAMAQTESVELGVDRNVLLIRAGDGFGGAFQQLASGASDATAA